MKLTLSILLLIALCACGPGGRENKLSPEAAAALHAPGKVTLYSLEPSPVSAPDTTNLLRYYTILGQTDLEGPQAATAVAAFEAAVPQRAPHYAADCFDPRHALRTTFQGHTYDFLLCYACGEMEIYRDDTNFVAGAYVSGSPDVLNGLLTAAHIPLATPPPSERK